jgi:SAM-dependent methyltransferase
MDDSDDPVARFHNLVARQPDDVVASTRPPGTSRQDLDRMVDDVLAKLALRADHVVCEIGCGTGVLAVPIARRVARLVGVDFAEEALSVLARRLEQAGLADRSVLVDLDVLGPSFADLVALGPFDRVLVYATFHYVRERDQAARFLHRVVELLAPGGVALIGNLPLVELAEAADKVRTGSPRERMHGLASWLRREPTPVPRNLEWRVRALARTAWTRWRPSTRRQDRRNPSPTHELPAGTVIPLRIDMIESLLDSVGVPVTHRWAAPAIGVPMFLDRADLLITRQPASVVRPARPDH